MATTTTNFGWDIPQSTDLVKDGATAIAALGQDIDTAFVDFKGGTTGQVLKKTSGTDLDVEWGTASSGLTLINTTSFSAVASQSVNDVFSATYDNYKLIWTLSGCSADASVFIKLRVSGTDSSANYNFMVPSYSTDGASSFGNGAGDSTGIFTYRIDGGNNNSSYLCDLTISNPFLSEFTDFVGVGVGRKGTGLTEGASIVGTHTLANSYTGFTIITSSGNFTGKVILYGLAK